MDNKENNIVVLGGTFNPLSKAHGYIIKLASKIVKASKMILVPTSDKFLKSWKEFDSNNIISSEVRIAILNEFNKRNKNVEISHLELDGITYKTFDTLTKIKEENPEANIYFIFGSEKLSELQKWYRYKDLLENFNFIVIQRNKDNINDLLEKNEYLQGFLLNFIFVEDKKDIAFISSTKIREAIKNKDFSTIKDLTYNYCVKILKKEGTI